MRTDSAEVPLLPAVAAEGGPHAWKGLVAGAVGGAVAGLVMAQVQTRVMPKVKEALSKGEEAGEGGGEGEKSEPATVKAAEAVSEHLLGREIPEERRSQAGTAAHYAMAIGTGAIYGVAAEYAPAVTRGFGTAYGTAVWAAADETLVPALGLSKPPTEHPPSTHAYALASHLVYGATVEAVRRAVRAAL